jgi:hypothetical protein
MAKILQRGGFREGAGRPKGSRNIHSRDSVKKLEDLGFYPIEKMIELYEEICERLVDGSVRVGTGAYAQLKATQATLINNLMQYGYRRVPEKQEVETTERTPINIILGDDNDVSEEIIYDADKVTQKTVRGH